MTELKEGFNIVKLFMHWGIFPKAETIEADLIRLKDKNPKLTADQIVQVFSSRAKKLATAQGIIAALPGAIPGLGTAAQVAVMAGTATPETILLFRKMAYLQLMIAHINGHPIKHDTEEGKLHDERVEEFVTILGIMSGAVIPAKEAMKKYTSKFATVQISKNLSAKTLREINKRIGFTLLTKFGVKRGGIALGRLIPFGVGAGVGGAMNYASISQFSKSAVKFYGGSSEDYTIVED